MNQIQSFEDAMAWIRQMGKSGSIPGLERIRQLLQLLGDPQDRLKVVHIAGTNGKGSTVAFLDSILRENGYLVGTYTSPAVFDYRERFHQNGVMISREDLTSLYSRVCQAVEKMEVLPTAFEIETAAAFLYFEEQHCEIVLVETGLGGTEDATNVMDWVLCSVITSISLDHQEFLGQTLLEIAEAKAGILRFHCPVVVYNQTETVEELMRQRAKELEAPLVVTGMPRAFLESTILEQTFSYECASHQFYPEVAITMAGRHQISNCITALETVEVLKEQGFYFQDDQVLAGCRKAALPGRFQVVSSTPLVVVDGAHNPGGVKRLSEAIGRFFSHRELIFIMGVMKDKDYLTMIQEMAPLARKIFTIAPDNPRSLPANELAEAIRPYNSNVSPRDTIEQAVENATLEAGFDGVVVSFGSLYSVREVVEAVEKETK